MTARHETLGLLFGLVGMVMFAGTLPANRLAVGELDPFFLTAARAAFAGAAALGALILMRRPSPRPHGKEIVGICVCLILGFPLFSALAMVSVPAAHGGVVLGILPMATAVAATLLARERPSLGFWLSAMLGSLVVVTFTVRHGSGGVAPGDLWLVAAILAAAVGYTLSGKLAAIVPGWEVIAWALVLALPISLPAVVWLWPANSGHVSWQAWAALIYVAAFSQFIGFFFWNVGLSMGGIARVGQVQLLQPFAIVALAALVNGEAIDLVTLLFAGAVILTVMIGRRMPVKRQPA